MRPALSLHERQQFRQWLISIDETWTASFAFHHLSSCALDALFIPMRSRYSAMIMYQLADRHLPAMLSGFAALPSINAVQCEFVRATLHAVDCGACLHNVVSIRACPKIRLEARRKSIQYTPKLCKGRSEVERMIKDYWHPTALQGLPFEEQAKRVRSGMTFSHQTHFHEFLLYLASTANRLQLRKMTRQGFCDTAAAILNALDIHAPNGEEESAFRLVQLLQDNKVLWRKVRTNLLQPFDE